MQRISAGIDFDVQYGQEDFNLKNADVDGHHLSHQPIAGKGDQKRLIAVCKDMAISNIYRTAGQIVRDVFNNNMNVEPVRKANIVRTTNAARQRRQPTPPRLGDKNFSPNVDYFKAFFFRGKSTATVNGESASSYLFITEYMADKLIRAKRLCFDGTFFVVKDPILQLYTIDGFLMNENGNEYIMSYL